MFRASLHPDGLAARTVNFAEWARHLLGTLHRAASQGNDPALDTLEQEVLAYPAVVALGLAPSAERGAPHDELLVPCTHDLPVERLSLFTTLTSFGHAARHHARRAVGRAVLPGRRGDRPPASGR